MLSRTRVVGHQKVIITISKHLFSHACCVFHGHHYHQNFRVNLYQILHFPWLIRWDLHQNFRWHVLSLRSELLIQNKMNVKWAFGWERTLLFKHGVLSLQIFNVLLMRVVFAAHKLNVFSCFLQNLCTTCLSTKRTW